MMTWQMTFYSISRTPTLVDIVGMHQDVLHFLLLTFGICSTGLMMNYHAPTILQRAGIGVFEATYLHVILCFGNFYVLQKEENIIRISIVQHLAGHSAPPLRQRYLDSSRRILRILGDYPNRQRLQYLRAIAHNLTF